MSILDEFKTVRTGGINPVDFLKLDISRDVGGGNEWRVYPNNYSEVFYLTAKFTVKFCAREDSYDFACEAARTILLRKLYRPIYANMDELLLAIHSGYQKEALAVLDKMMDEIEG